MTAVLVDDECIKSLFDIIEELSYDSSDPYHYTVIRVLVSGPRACLVLLFEGSCSLLAVGSERTIYDLSTRSRGREKLDSIDKQSYQNLVNAW